MESNLSIYIHIPFCRSRCSYCDFVTSAGKLAAIPEYLDTLRAEIGAVASRSRIAQPVHSVYFGGGTPSLLTPVQLRTVLEFVRGHFQLTSDVEITLEANPGDCSLDYASGIVKAGVNRVSLGMQSASRIELQRMARRHSFQDTVAGMEALRDAGVNNISLDLIYGFPEQTLDSWQRTISAALALDPDHLSLYALSVEDGTPLDYAIRNGKLPAPDDELSADQYAFACERLADGGFYHYEISNWSRTVQTASRHNCQYWLIRPYLGFGAGAHGYFNHVRTRNPGTMSEYIARAAQIGQNQSLFPFAEETVPQAIDIEQSDFVIFGLRLLKTGVNAGVFEERFGKRLQDAYPRQLEKLLKNGSLLLDNQGNLLLNERFAFVSNQVMKEFI